jgi:hypothetical protein
VTRETSPPAKRLLMIALVLGIALRIADYFHCRTLSLDEARLAVNIAARSFRGLLSPLAMDQSAPPLFLWGERAITLLLGHSDCALRLLPVVAGTVSAALMYPLARRFLPRAEARLAAMIGIFCPLLITYSNTVKQYSVELLAGILLLLAWERALAGPFRGRAALTLVAAGAVAPWMSLTSVFVLAACWVELTQAAVRRRKGVARTALAATLCWGLSAWTAYVVAYRAASENVYMRRFWDLAFLTPSRPEFLRHLWKSIEDQVWGFAAGDPLVDRRPFLLVLHVATVVVILLCLAGTRRVLREQGPGAVWMLWGPGVLTLGASVAGVFPIAPRLTLFLLPALILLLVAGLSEAVDRLPLAARRPGLAVAAVVILLPLEFQAVVRTFAVEPSARFQDLVHELRSRRGPDEPVYIFARSLPAWIYYSTDWSRPDSLRLEFLARAASAGGAAFENLPSRDRVSEPDPRTVVYGPAASAELLGLPSGMEWREVQEHVALRPDSGWVSVESRRIERAAHPAVWVLASGYYAPESELFTTLDRSAVRRSFANVRNGSVLVRYEFAPGRLLHESP